MQNADLLILAAGFGTRLGSITEQQPKALVAVGGKPLIVWNIELAAAAGFKRIFINLHYLGERIRSALGDGSRWGLCIEYSDEQPQILDTGGAIRNIEHLLAHDLLITMNCDALLGRDFSLSGLLGAHRQQPEALATLVLRRDKRAEQFGALGVNPAGRIVSFLGKTYLRDTITEVLMYTGVQVVSRALIARMPPAGSIFSITRDTYPQLLSEGGYLSSLRYDGLWNDVGTPERLAEARAAVAHWGS